MALTKEILNILDNKEEPLSKRLKIADGILKSGELSIHHRESLLLKWIVRSTKDKTTTEVWEVFDRWLDAEQIKQLSRSDIRGADILYILNSITRQISDLQDTKQDVHRVIITLSQKLIQHNLFQQYFKHDLNSYCSFIAAIVSVIEDLQLLLSFLKCELFSKSIVLQEEFPRTFMTICFIPFINVIGKHKNDKLVFEEVCAHIQKCLFTKNFKNFEEYMKLCFEKYKNSDIKEPPLVPKLLFENLITLYQLDVDTAACAYKTLFYSFCKSYNNDFGMVFKFSLLLLYNLGFITTKDILINNTSNLRNLDSDEAKDLTILKELLSVLTTNTNTLDFEVTGVKFTDVLRKITVKTLRLTRENTMQDTLEILNHIITINPLVIEPIISEILVLIMLCDHSQYQFHYDRTIIAIFEVFGKLHRIQSLISKMVPALKAGLEGSFKSENLSSDLQTEKNVCVTDVLSEPILNYFSECIIGLASWQVMNLFKTFIFHLNAAVDSIDEDSGKHIYIEFLSTLICHFMQTVRMAEHTVSSTVVEKFINGMDEVRDILAKFGTSLLNREHNHILMRAFLNICYTWAELYIILSYYSFDNEIKMTRIIDTDSSACNITYLHNYLTRDQWCTIAQRITNFGEKPCKQIMHQLYIQKIKAMMLFDDVHGSDVQIAVMKSLSEDVEENLELIVSESFILNNIVVKMDTTDLISMGKCILKALLEENKRIVNSRYIHDCQMLTNSLLYNTMQKIHKLVKRKRKYDEDSVNKTFSVSVWESASESTFFRSDENAKDNLDEFIKVFNKNLLDGCSSRPVDVKINEEKLRQYLEVLKKLPIVYSPHQVQIICLFQLIAFLIDFKENMNPLTKTSCECLITGIIQNNPLLILNNIPVNIILEKFPTCLTNYEEIITYATEALFHDENITQKFESGVNYIKEQISNETCLRCAVIFLNTANKFKKSKMTVERKKMLLDYSSEIYKSLLKYLTNSKTCKFLEPYALVLRNYLSKNNKAAIEKLTPLLKDYLNFAMEEASSNKISSGCFTLFVTLLHHKTQFKEIDDSLILQIWNAYKTIDIPDLFYEEYTQLVVLIFEHVTNEQFSVVVDSLLQFSLDALKQKDSVKFCKHLKTWNSILQCSFNPVKTKMWCTVLEGLLQEMLTPTVTNEMQNIHKEIVAFEIHIIQTTQLLLTPTMTDMFIYTTSVFMKQDLEDFTSSFGLCINLLESLLKQRRPIIMDRLPPYLLQYRHLMRHLCAKSDSELSLDDATIQNLAACALQLEKLTKHLTSCHRDMARISVYLIADVLQQYEQTTLHPNIKIHLNNCLYSLISLCDQHAVSYLLRVLSVASTEMFKVMYENYKKYYRFTGKV